MLTDSGHAKTLEYDCPNPSISSGDGLGSKFDGQKPANCRLGTLAPELPGSGR